MNDFLYSGPLDATNSTRSGVLGDAPQLSDRLLERRLRFTTQIPISLNSDICSPRDRRAVLAVYDEAMETIKSTNANYLEVEAEAEAKIKTILGIELADANDRVFLKNLLSPIDPTYAEPRIEASDDGLSYHASWRLHEWRQDGWPGSYPGRAIEKEKTMKGDPHTWRDRDWGDKSSDD
jgi:hypothetical protein